MSDRWFYLREGRQIGPVPLEDLRHLVRAGTVAPTDAAWPEGGAARPVGDVPDLDCGSGQPDWLEELRQAELTPAKPTHPVWLDDVKHQEKAPRPAYSPVAGPGRPTAPADPTAAWLEDVRRHEKHPTPQPPPAPAPLAEVTAGKDGFGMWWLLALVVVVVACVVAAGVVAGLRTKADRGQEPPTLPVDADAE